MFCAIFNFQTRSSAGFLYTLHFDALTERAHQIITIQSPPFVQFEQLLSTIFTFFINCVLLLQYNAVSQNKQSQKATPGKIFVSFYENHSLCFTFLSRCPRTQHYSHSLFDCSTATFKLYSKGNTAQFPPNGLSTAPAAAARHLRCQNAR